MPVPDQFRLNVPHFQPIELSAHEQNLRAIERAMNGLPIPRAQRFITNSTYTLVADAAATVVNLYEGTGYRSNERGTFNSIVTFNATVQTEAMAQQLVIRGNNDFTILSEGVGGLKWRVPEAVDDVFTEIITFQGMFDMTSENQIFQPRISLEAALATSNVFIAALSCIHMFYPLGLMDTLKIVP